MNKVVTILAFVIVLLSGILIGTYGREMVASASTKALEFADIEYSAPLTVTMLADIGQGVQQTVTIPLMFHNALRIASPSDNVLSLETSTAQYEIKPSRHIDNIGIPYVLEVPAGIDISWAVGKFGDNAILDGVVRNIDTDDTRVIDKIIVSASFYDFDGKFLSVSDSQPVPYGESELAIGKDVGFQLSSGDDAPFVDIGSYIIHVEVGYGEPERKRGQ